MSLLKQTFEEFTIIDKTTSSDGYGGVEVSYVDGATISAALSFNSSVEALTAQAAGATSLYTITTRKAVNLQYHDLIRRKKDGKVLRITSDGDDNLTPPSATLDMRQVQAEEYVLPVEG